MGKSLQDGLIMENSFLIIDEKKPGFHISARVIQILAILIGSWSAFSVLLKCLEAPVNIYHINAAILICAGILFALCIFPKYDLVKLFFICLFYGLFLYSRLPELKNGFYLYENLVISRLRICYDYSGYNFVADKSTQAADTTLLMIMIMIPVIGLFTIAVVRNRLVNLCSLILFLPVTASFLLGVIPSEKYLIAYIAAILYLAKSGLPYRHIANRDQRTLLHRINSRAAVWMSFLGLLVFFILKLFVSEDQYDNIAQLNDMKSKVQQTFMETSLQDISDKITEYKLFEYEIADGGLLGGELGKDGKVEYSGDEQLEITAPMIAVAEGFYLKGYVGTDYTGSRWLGHSKEDKKQYYELLENIPEGSFTPVNQTNLLLSFLLSKPVNDLVTGEFQFLPKWNEVLEQTSFQVYQGMMKVEYRNANKKYIYAPYFTNYDLLDRSYYEQDLYSAPSIRSDYYEFNYYNNVQLGGSDFALLENLGGLNYSQYEELYRNYVYDVYTKLPEKGLDRLKKEFSSDNASLGGLSLPDKIDFVKNYLSHNTQYTLSPGRLPKGKDFVEYFLYENKKGYCSHYASAATLMLRAMGVPARYAEGYCVGKEQVQNGVSDSTQSVTSYTVKGAEQTETSTSKINVLDSNAHAWVEVYVDGCGWIPVEFTPGAPIEYNISMISDLQNADNYMDNINENAPPTQMPEEPTQAAVDQNQQDKTSSQQDQAAEIAKEKEKAKLNTAFIIAFILIAAAAVSLFVIIILIRHGRVKNTRSHNRRAIFLFAEIEKILTVSKGLPDKKARLEDYEEYVREQNPYIDPKLFEACMETVKRARFGGESISLNDLRRVEEFRYKVFRDVYEELPFFKKLGLKILLLF